MRKLLVNVPTPPKGGGVDMREKKIFKKKIKNIFFSKNQLNIITETKIK